MRNTRPRLAILEIPHRPASLLPCKRRHHGRVYELRDGRDGTEEEESNDRQEAGRGLSTVAERMQDPTAWYIHFLIFWWNVALLTLATLGSGESGKSTIVKQMKIIHQNGYTVDELALYRLTIYKNLIDCSKALISAMRQFGIEPVMEVNREHTDYLLDYQVDPDPHTPLDSRVGNAVESIWRDGCVEVLMERQSEFYLMDSAP